MQGSIWKAGLLAGLIAGVVELIVLIGLAAGQGVSLWVPVHMTAAIVLGQGVLTPADAFDPKVTAVALVLHFGLSLIYGVVIALLIRSLERMPALAVGVAFGIAVWLVNYFVLAPSFFPWLTASRGAVQTPFVHAIFGVAAVGAYLAIAARERRTGADRRKVDQTVAEERRRPFERRGPA
jgi:uncharacterized membrane protein YagU involved in acid resistance